MAFSRHISSVTPAASGLNLGVTFDENFNFKQHILKTCRCCFYHIRFVAKTIATALVSSRLDYCNSLVYKNANKEIAKLQRFQNGLAKVVARSPCFSRSVPLLKSLHWFPEILHYFQDLYNSLSSNLLYTTSISKFDANCNESWGPSFLGCHTNCVELASC